MVAARIGILPIVVIRTFDGELHAYVDRCLHQGARLSGGSLLGDAQDPRQVVKCPWHGYEYDVRTGCAVFDRRLALTRVQVVERNGLILAFRDPD